LTFEVSSNQVEAKLLVVNESNVPVAETGVRGKLTFACTAW
jgi:hypothetical protein